MYTVAYSCNFLEPTPLEQVGRTQHGTYCYPLYTYSIDRLFLTCLHENSWTGESSLFPFGLPQPDKESYGSESLAHPNKSGPETTTGEDRSRERGAAAAVYDVPRTLVAVAKV